MFLDNPKSPEFFGQPSIDGTCPKGLTPVVKELPSQQVRETLEPAIGKLPTAEQVYCVSIAKSDQALALEQANSGPWSDNGPLFLIAILTICALAFWLGRRFH